MTAILALDLGTTTGWALRTPEGQIVSGTQSLKPGRYECGGMRFLRFRAKLVELQAGASTIGAVYFEEVRRHAGVDASRVYGVLLVTLTSWCEGQGIAFAGVTVGTIKEHATGKGSADTAAMVATMQALGFNPVEENEADALAAKVSRRSARLAPWLARIRGMARTKTQPHAAGQQLKPVVSHDRLPS